MNKEELFEQLVELNKSVNEQFHSIQAGKQIPQIEIDLLLNHLQKFYEGVKALDKYNSTDSTPGIDPHQTDDLLADVEVSGKSQSDNEPPAIHGKQSNDDRSTVLPVASQQESLISNIETRVNNVEELHSEEEVILKGQNTSGNSRIKANVNPAPSATLFDTVQEVNQHSHTTTSVYEKISSSKEDKSIVTRLQKNPVSDLKKSIGINEKFSFINELFDGDLNAYNDAIEKLNTSDDHAAALELIESDFSIKYGWNDDDSALDKLKTLVSRRFMA